MRNSLQNLPTRLYDAFDATFERIRAQGSGRERIGISTIFWLREALRPLKMEELREIFAIRFEDSNIDRTFSPSVQMILGACMGLVEMDPATSTVQLVHFAVLEYLQNRPVQSWSWRPPELGLLCLRYFSLDDFAQGPLREEALVRKHGQSYKFLQYASVYWSKHLHKTSHADEIKLLSQFLGKKLNYQAMIQFHQLYTGYREMYWCDLESRSRTALHLACLFGLVDTLKSLIEQGIPLDTPTAICGTCPIHNAAAGDVPELLRVLLDAKPDLYVSNWYGTALHCAAERGRSDNLIILIKDHGVPVDITEKQFGRTALHCAVQQSHWHAVKVLLELGANPNARKKNGQSPIHVVEDGVSDLAECEAALDLIGTPGFSPEDLRSSWFKGRFLLLLAKGADLNMQDDYGNTPLHVAALRCNPTQARILIALGVDGQIRGSLLNGGIEMVLSLMPTYRDEILNLVSKVSRK